MNQKRNLKKGLAQWLFALAIMLTAFGLPTFTKEAKVSSAKAKGVLCVTTNDGKPVKKAAENNRPEYFNLKDEGKVTSVKNQGSFGTCWAFATIAAAETTLLTQLGMTNEEYKAKYGSELDLSERALAYFARTPLTDENPLSSVFGTQTGEGIYVEGKGKDVKFQTGGVFQTSTSVFSTGTGMLYEKDVPYQGKAGIIEYAYKGKDGKGYYDPKTNQLVTDFSGDNQEIIDQGYTPVRLQYDTRYDSWDVSEDYRFKSITNLIEGKILPSPVNKVQKIVNVDGVNTLKVVYDSYNESATNAIKDEVLEGRAVSIAFCADTAHAGDEKNPPKYINLDNYAHYSYGDGAVANHAVTIVGYDDNYKKENFLDHSQDEKGDGEAHLPQGDGAWIVKNSWGSLDGEFPNRGDWGVNGTGYFYLSYYDQSLSLPESYLFDISQMNIGSSQYMVDQYDTMPVAAYTGVGVLNTTLREANVFYAKDDEYLRKISVNTAMTNEKIHAQIYQLKDGYKSPIDGKMVSEIETEFDFAGYHSIYINPVYLKEGTYYSVVVSETTESDQGTISVATMATETSEQYRRITQANNPSPIMCYGKAVVNEGESFIGVDDDWADWTSDDAEDLRKGIIPGYFGSELDFAALKEDMKNGVLSQEDANGYVVEMAQLQGNLEGSSIPEKYIIKDVTRSTVDNFSIKTYSVKVDGSCSGISYKFNENGVLKITGYGSINKVTKNSLAGVAPWLEYISDVKKIIIDDDIQDIFQKDGKFNEILAPGACFIQVGFGKDAKLYWKDMDTSEYVKDKIFTDSITGKKYVADKDGVVTEYSATKPGDKPTEDPKNPCKSVKAVKKTVTVKKKKAVTVKFTLNNTDAAKKTTDAITAKSSKTKVAKILKKTITAKTVTVKVKGLKKGKATVTVKAGSKAAKTTIKVK